MTETEIIQGCLKGNAKFQKLLYDKYTRVMMGVCLRYAANQHEAQDILQDGFVKVFQKLDTYSGKGAFEGWMRRVFVNTALDQLRKKKEERFNIDIDSVEYQLEATGSVLEKIAAEDLLKVIQQIPVGYRTIFNLYAIEGYSHKEIAEELGITVNTSKSQYSRAKGYLRQRVEKLYK